MTTFNVTLPDDVAEIVTEKAAQAGYRDPGEYLQKCISDTLSHQARERLESMLIEGLESGPPIEVTPEYWARKKAGLIQRYHENAVK